MDKSRQQFEEEFRKHSTLDKDDIFKMDYESDDYYYLATRQAWFWWRVSRESYLSEQQELTCVLGDNKKLTELLDEYINRHRSENKK